MDYLLGRFASKELMESKGISFGAEMLLENARTLIDSVIRAKPAAAKGRYVKSIALSSTMGPGVRVDLASVEGHA